MAYSLLNLKPTASEEEQRNALMATIDEMVAEGKTPEEAQAQAKKLLSEVMQPMSIPVQDYSDFGINIASTRTALARNSTGMRKNQGVSPDDFQDVYNLPRSRWNSPWNPSPQGPRETVYK